MEKYRVVEHIVVLVSLSGQVPHTGLILEKPAPLVDVQAEVGQNLI